jgi:thiamine transport system permease protein
VGRRLDESGAALTLGTGLAPYPRTGFSRRDGRARPTLMTTPPAWAFGLLPAVFLILFFIWPLTRILSRGGNPDGVRLWTESDVWHVVRFTFLQAAASTVLTLLVAMPAAYVLHRYAFFGRRLVLALVTVPFVLPTVVVGAAFRVLLPEPLIGTVWAILIAHVFFNIAVVVRVVGGLWAHLDPRYDAAARTLGAPPWRVFRTVTWPLLRPAVVAAAALVFLFTFTSFGVVLVLGGPANPTLEVEIYRRTAQLLDLSGAAALCILQLAAMALVLAISARLQAQLGVRQRLLPPEQVLQRPRRPGQKLLLGLVLFEAILLAVPMATLALRSFRVGDGWGLVWWRRLAVSGPTTRDIAAWDAVRVSLTYAAATVVISVVIGGLAACAVAYAKRWAKTLDTGLMLPLGTSAVTVGFGLLITFNAPPFDLRGSWVMVPLGHALVAVPLVVRTVLPVLRSLDPRYREVAVSLGASPWRAWRTVDGPSISRALAVGAGFAAAVSLGEFGATAFLARTDTPTLPMQVVRLLGLPGDANAGQAAALATLLMVLTAAVVLLTERLRVHRAGTL